MSNDFIKTEELVEYVLRVHHESRKDDFFLIYKVYSLLEPLVIHEGSFKDVMLNHKLYGLPSFHTITRARRKVFEKNPNLKPEKITKKRTEQEENYKEYSRT